MSEKRSPSPIVEQRPENRRKLDNPQPRERKEYGFMGRGAGAVSIGFDSRSVKYGFTKRDAGAMSIAVDSSEKIVDSQSGEMDNTACRDGTRWCPICFDNALHPFGECPNKANAFGKFCLKCDCAAKEECEQDHRDEVCEVIKICTFCGNQGTHWEEECPFARQAAAEDPPYMPPLDPNDMCF